MIFYGQRAALGHVQRPAIEVGAYENRVDLAAKAPSLAQVLAGCARLWYVILDGTLVRIHRVAEDRPYYSGKHKPHGANVQLLADPRGGLLWASPALPGSTHDLTAAREHGLIDAVTEADLWAYADLAYPAPARTSSYRFAADAADYRVTGGRSTATALAVALPANAPSPPSRPGRS